MKEIGASRFSFSFSTVSLSSRKSNFVPTRMIGVLGQWWETSGNHYRQQIKPHMRKVVSTANHDGGVSEYSLKMSTSSSPPPPPPPPTTTTNNYVAEYKNFFSQCWYNCNRIWQSPLRTTGYFRIYVHEGT